MLWDQVGGSFAPTRLALELAAHKHTVLFLEHCASGTRDTHGLPIPIASLDEFGLPPFAVALAWRGVPLGSLDEITPRIQAWLEQHETFGEPRIAILNAPFAPLARLLPFLQARGYWTIYYPQDDYAAMFELGMHQFNPLLEEYLTARADLNLALSTPVANRLRRLGREFELVPDAVEPSELRGGVRDSHVVRGQECTIGFWGSLLAPMVDIELLRTVAQARPAWAIHLLGPYGTPPQYPSVYEQLRNVPNIHFHGGVARSELKHYAQSFDTCVIPAPNNDMSRGRDPIKLYEYLACYKPVVATHMPHIQHAPYTHVTTNANEFIDAIETARRETIDPSVIDSFLAQHTWSKRADTLLEHVQRMVQQPRAQYGGLDGQTMEQLERAQPVGTLSPNEWQNIMFAVREHDTLKRELTAVQEWARELEQMNRTQPQSVGARFKKILTGE